MKSKFECFVMHDVFPSFCLVLSERWADALEGSGLCQGFVEKHKRWGWAGERGP